VKNVLAYGENSIWTKDKRNWIWPLKIWRVNSGTNTHAEDEVN